MEKEEKWELLRGLMRALEEMPISERIIRIVEEINGYGIGIKFYFDFIPKKANSQQASGQRNLPLKIIGPNESPADFHPEIS